jgi:hypothetical protein
METKPGYLTTEFWVSIFTGAYMFFNTTGVLDQIPDQWAGLFLAVIGGAYTVSRGQAKNGVKPE